MRYQYKAVNREIYHVWFRSKMTLTQLHLRSKSRSVIQEQFK
jgi:hypothetical protein